MKKIILFGLLALVMVFVLGCEGIDLSKVSDEDLARIAQQAIVCNEPYIRFETGCCLDQNNDNICDDNNIVTPEATQQQTQTMQQTQATEGCTAHQCVFQDFEGGIKECGIMDDGCGGTVNCNYQKFTGGLECPSGLECVNNLCVETDTCVPRECIHQDFEGGIKECGTMDDGCGGTVNCNYQTFTGGLECPAGLECVNNLCEAECVPKTRDDCIHQEFTGGTYQCGEMDDGCGGTVNCNYQTFTGGLECPDGKTCVNNYCVE